MTWPKAFSIGLLNASDADAWLRWRATLTT